MPAAPHGRWRPASEAEAVAGRTVFIEWCQAMRGVALDGPAALARWRGADPAAFADAMRAFLAFPSGEGASVPHALFSGHGDRAALITPERTWSRADLLTAATPLPPPVATALATLSLADLPALGAFHLLDAATSPDDHVPWHGDAADWRPLGAWLLRAAVVLRRRP